MKYPILIIILMLFSYISQSQIDEIFEREIDYQHFSGVVLVKQGNDKIAEICHGQTANDSDFNLFTPFDIGSISKQFTAAAILQLVEAGKIALDDPINLHLADWGGKRWKKVNIHQLLTHTSGIPSLFQTEQGLDLFFPEQSAIQLNELISRFRDGKLLFNPGEEFSYSNSGYILLAAIVEKVSGITYGQYLQQEIFQPYELNNCSFGPSNEAALPYYGYRNGLIRRAPLYHPSWMIGAGGIYASANDLAKWVDIIQSERWLTPELRTSFLEGYVNVGGDAYGYGWQITSKGMIEHDGGNAGFVSFLSFKPSSKEVVIILTNRSFEDIHMLGKSTERVRYWGKQIWQSLAGEKIATLPEIIIETPSHTNGTYKSEDSLIIKIMVQDSFLIVSSPYNYPSRLIANSTLKGETPDEEKLIQIAELLQKGKYWQLAKHCDGEMSFVAYSGLMAIGLNMIKKPMGEISQLIPFFVSEDYGLLRMKGEKYIQDIIVYFNESGEIQGIFKHDSYSLDKAVEMIAYPIGQHAYFLDGFPYGEQDAILTIDNQVLIVNQHKRKVLFFKE